MITQWSLSYIKLDDSNYGCFTQSSKKNENLNDDMSITDTTADTDTDTCIDTINDNDAKKNTDLSKTRII